MSVIDTVRIRRAADLIYFDSTVERNRLEIVLTNEGAEAACNRMIAFLDSAGNKLSAEVKSTAYACLGIKAGTCREHS